MKRISLNKVKQIYDELKFHKVIDSFAGVYLHNDSVKVGYSNNFGKSDFIKRDEPRVLIIDNEEVEELLNDYYKKDAVKVMQYIINDFIDYYNEKMQRKKKTYLSSYCE